MRVVLCSLVMCWCIVTVDCKSSQTETIRSRRIGILVVSEVASQVSNARDRRDVSETEEKPTITRLDVVSKITSRFAVSSITSEMRNTGSTNKQATFKVQIPLTAFVSNFTMLIDDELFIAEVKEKKSAEKEYEEALKQNRTAGKVSSESAEHLNEPDRGKEWFLVSINVKADSAVSFELTYQELLRRKHGYYTHTVSIRPGQVIDALSVETYVYERQGFSAFEVEEPKLSINDLEGSLTDTVVTETSAHVREVVYTPSVENQKRMNSGTGIAGDFTIRYDVVHGNDAGAIQFENNYFVHFFSPSSSDLTPLTKNIIFVIDISGSMSGEKMEQTRGAMQTILDQLRENDKFMILIFDDAIETWPNSKELVRVNGLNIARAKEYCTNKLVADGGTNIHDALLQAVNTLKSIGKVGANMIIFLTDGEATVGETTNSVIIDRVAGASNQKVSIFSLGFGFSLDYDLLQAVSYRTGGFPRRIYEGVDAGLQLQNFFAEIDTPLLYDVNIRYQSNAIDVRSLTLTRFSQYFNGSELVVAGKLLDNAPREWTCTVDGNGHDLVTWNKSIDTSVLIVMPPEAQKAYSYGFLEKLYVYLKIHDLLNEKYKFDDAQKIKEIENYALGLALEYNLVTPLTSMLVVQRSRSGNTLENQGPGVPRSPPKGGAAYDTAHASQGMSAAALWRPCKWVLALSFWLLIFKRVFL